jgi:hypothetical protein
MREAHRNPPEDGTPRERLRWYLQKTGEVFEHREEFLRLLLVLVMSDEAADAPEALQTVVAIRNEGRNYMRSMIESSFQSEGQEAAAEVAEGLAHFGMAGFDGSFVSLESGDGKPIQEYMNELTVAMIAIGEGILANRRARGRV